MFDSLTRFTVLIERRATPMLWVLSLLLLLTSAMFGAPRASAQPGREAQMEKRLHKMSPDLKAGIDNVKAPKQRWARERNGHREVQVIQNGRPHSEASSNCSSTSALASASSPRHACTQQAKPEANTRP